MFNMDKKIMLFIVLIILISVFAFAVEHEATVTLPGVSGESNNGNSAKQIQMTGDGTIVDYFIYFNKILTVGIINSDGDVNDDNVNDNEPGSEDPVDPSSGLNNGIETFGVTGIETIATASDKYYEIKLSKGDNGYVYDFCIDMDEKIGATNTNHGKYCFKHKENNYWLYTRFYVYRVNDGVINKLDCNPIPGAVYCDAEFPDPIHCECDVDGEIEIPNVIRIKSVKNVIVKNDNFFYSLKITPKGSESYPK